jgi:hypothetical protein
MAGLLRLSVLFEMGDWDGVETQAGILGFDMAVLPALYQESVTWADALRSL